MRMPASSQQLCTGSGADGQGGRCLRATGSDAPRGHRHASLWRVVERLEVDTWDHVAREVRREWEVRPRTAPHRIHEACHEVRS